MVFPATTQESKDTPHKIRRERERERRSETMVFPATIQASKDRPDKKRRERERCSQLRLQTMVFPATTQASKDSPGREGVYLSVASRNTPKEAKEEGRGKREERGLRPPTGYRCGHLMACPKTAYLEFNNLSGLGKQLWHKPPAVRSGHAHLWAREKDKPPFDGSTGGTLRAHPGLSRGETRLLNCVRA